MTVNLELFKELPGPMGSKAQLSSDDLEMISGGFAREIVIIIIGQIMSEISCDRPVGTPDVNMGDLGVA